MELKTFETGDKVELKTSTRSWSGTVLESYDSEIILLKLDTGYNIGIREREILDAKLIEKYSKVDKQKPKLQENSKLPNVAIIITGGTISSRLDPKSGAVISTDAEEILNIAPEIKNICNIVKIDKPFMKWSENMSQKDWKKLAENVELLLNDSSISGVIITHGTDFIHYSASALSFMLGKLNKPVALTYSQRSIDRGSTDAELNLVCAAKYAVSDIAEVALIGHKNLDDEICLAMPANKTRKLHSSRRDAFTVINASPYAEISKTEFKILREFNARNDKKIKIDTKYTTDVALVKVYPGQDPKILEFYANEGYKGVVLELSGFGHFPTQQGEHNWLPTVKRVIDKGLVICGAAQTIYGTLNQNVYSAGRDIEKTGLIFLKDILAETALVKLSWVLGHPAWIKENKVKERMLENISGEFNDKLNFDF